MPIVHSTNIKNEWEKYKNYYDDEVKSIQSNGSITNFLLLSNSIKKDLSLICSEIYNNCNDYQKKEYAALKNHITLDEKDFVLNEIKRVLNEADEEYKKILNVMYDFFKIFIYDLKKYELKYSIETDDLLSNMLNYFKDAFNLERELGINIQYELDNIIKEICIMDLKKEFVKSKQVRSEILLLALNDIKVLEEWDFYNSFCNEVGIKKIDLEKELKKINKKERLKFWKRIGKKK
ncbi:MAG: hypothetical protein Q4F88_01735 [Eubacteriales bacterium]|nr:hypothetical protein [Eubacteriales bacterium]